MADLELPQRILAADYVPTGERVNIYQKLSVLSEIKHALDEEEQKFIYKSQFVKLFEISGKPAWSGLCYGKYPPSGKKRRRGNGEHFYEQLFGGARDVSAEKVLQMLQNWSVKDRELRLRYACLLIVDAILLPSVHFPRVKIDVDHAEMVDDLNAFIANPWGRVSYEIIMESLLTRDFAHFATANVVVQGFFLAIQMVVLEAVPTIVEESDGSEDDDFVSRRGGQKLQLSMKKIRSLDEQDEVEVEMIIRPELEFLEDAEDISWSDDEEDPKVKAATSKKVKGKLRKPSASRSAGEGSGNVAIDLDVIAYMIDTKLASLASLVEGNLKSYFSDKINKLEKKIETVAANQSTVNNKIVVEGVTKWFKENVIVEEVIDNPVGARQSPSVVAKETVQPVASPISKPSPSAVGGGTKDPVNEELSVDEIAALYSQTSLKDFSSASGTPTVDPIGDNIVNNDTVNFTGDGDKSTHDKDGDGDSFHDIPMPNNIENPSCQATERDKNPSPMLPSEETSGMLPTTAQPSEKSVPPTLAEEAKTAQTPIPYSNMASAESVLPAGGDTGNVVTAIHNEKSMLSGNEADGGQHDVDVNVDFVDGNDDEVIISDVVSEKAPQKDDGDDATDVEGHRKSKRTKFASTKIDNRSLSVGDGLALPAKDVTDIIGREKCMSTKVMDALVKLSRHLLKVDDRKPRIKVFDTKFVAGLVKLFPRFSKADNRDAYLFSKAVVEKLTVLQPLFTEVFLALHLLTSKIEVLDCNVQLRTDVSMQNELRPISVMFPYLCRQIGGNELMANMSLTQLAIERVSGIPQITSQNDSGLVSILLMQAHAIGGVEQCRLMDLSDLEMDARKLITVLIETFRIMLDLGLRPLNR
ncbi:uncharacterized protein LOC112084431 [Eutrema salsugineum]|uniref:uncharacterized protein LOC112084431 n=1 Tax=Eutrema salsugineum TaxID=72664 RepID=UPI000CED41D2|nr:uncharacterized protein LOC112084431 [Eutrema salsugineum]